MKPRPKAFSLCHGCGQPSYKTNLSSVPRSRILSGTSPQRIRTISRQQRHLSSTSRRYEILYTPTSRSSPNPVPNLYSPPRPPAPAPIQSQIVNNNSSNSKPSSIPILNTPPPSSQTTTTTSRNLANLPLHTARITSLHHRIARLTFLTRSFFPSIRKSYYLPSHIRAYDPWNNLRVGDIVSYSLFTPEEAKARNKRRMMFEDWELEKMKADPKMRRVVGGRVKEVERERKGGFRVRSRLRRGRVRFVVRGVVSSFGEGWENRGWGRLNEEERRAVEEWEEGRKGSETVKK